MIDFFRFLVYINKFTYFLVFFFFCTETVFSVSFSYHFSCMLMMLPLLLEFVCVWDGFFSHLFRFNLPVNFILLALLSVCLFVFIHHFHSQVLRQHNYYEICTRFTKQIKKKKNWRQQFFILWVFFI